MNTTKYGTYGYWTFKTNTRDVMSPHETEIERTYGTADLLVRTSTAEQVRQ